MKPWLKKSLIAVFGASIVLGGLTACGSRGDHARGWSDERVTEMRGKAIERISGKLELNEAQKQKLGLLADELIAQRKAWRAQGRSAASIAGRDNQLSGLAAGASLAGLKGALMVLSLSRRAGLGFSGICSSTGAGSIRSWRQALEARARAKVRSGSSS